MRTFREKISTVIKVFHVITEEAPAFWIFLGVNLFFGGAALWLPSFVATQHPTAVPFSELIKAFEQGNGYLFGLALLAAASSYWMREYLEEKKTDFKRLKFFATGASFLIMILIWGLLALMIYKGFAPPTAETNVALGPLVTQIVFTVIALVMATYLFCLERIDNYPEFGKNLKDKVTEKNINQMDEPSKTGLET